MDIAFPIRMIGFRRGGGAVWALKIAEHLEEFGANVTFVVAKPLTKPIPQPITEFRSIEVPTPHLQDYAYAAPPGIGGALSDVDSYLFNKRVGRELKQHSFDVVTVHSMPGFARFIDEINCPVTIKLSGPPYSLFLDVLHPSANSYELLDSFDEVITTGITTDKVEENTNLNVRTINPGVNTNMFTPQEVGNDEDTILFVGRFVPAKNLMGLLEVFSSLQTKNPDAELILVGDGPKRNKIERQIDSLGIRDSVKLPGYIDNDQLPKYYRKADVFTLTSRNENHPITLLEAMSCGVPVVAPTIGAVPRIIDDEKNGLLYDSKDDLEEHLSYLLSHPEVRNEYGKEGREKAANEFDWYGRAQQFNKLLNEILE